ncbi:hypothetical protein GGD83_004113 [Rhodoblastus sphagnicola]|nr:hypothetical protein [Rhodoblastus sphagnicola]
MLRWGVLVGGLGLVVKYQIALPYSFGLVAWQVPGFFLQLSMLSSVGIYLVGSWAFAHSRLIFAAVAAFAVFEAFVGLITFSKTELTFTLVMIGLATVHRGASIWRVAPIAAVLFMTFATASPIVDFGRSVLFQRYNSVTGAGFDERVDIVASYFAGGREQFLADPFRSEFQGGLARLSYMNQASFAVHLYDSGMPGDSLNAIAVVLVPRFLWPDKPSLNYLGAGFTEKATGGTTSLSWPGRYAEVYWNFGWWGILFLMPPLGFVYALLSRYTLWVFAAQRWAHFPVVLMSMKYGIDIAGPYATSGVGGLSYIIVAHFASRLLERLVDRATNRWSAPAVARRDPRFA